MTDDVPQVLRDAADKVERDTQAFPGYMPEYLPAVAMEELRLSGRLPEAFDSPAALLAALRGAADAWEAEHDVRGLPAPHPDQ